MTSARAFALSNASLAGPVMAQWYIDSEAKIVTAALRASGPYLMAVNPSYPWQGQKRRCADGNHCASARPGISRGAVPALVSAATAGSRRRLSRQRPLADPMLATGMLRRSC